MFVGDDDHVDDVPDRLHDIGRNLPHRFLFLRHPAKGAAVNEDIGVPRIGTRKTQEEAVPEETAIHANDNGICVACFSR